ncbi:MAG: hypothetical protein IJ870_02685 [Alphaproteobacteria bacterium]|nr:hypothetical protein [Alphaproteobacteria bacterium]
MLKKISSFWEMIFGSSDNDAVDLKTRAFKKNGITPAYLLIAEDLKNKKDQVFEAAVYELCVIAKLKPEYQNEIMDILNFYLEKTHSPTNRTEYIKNTLEAFSFDQVIHN